MSGYYAGISGDLFYCAEKTCVDLLAGYTSGNLTVDLKAPERPTSSPISTLYSASDPRAVKVQQVIAQRLPSSQMNSTASPLLLSPFGADNRYQVYPSQAI